MKSALGARTHFSGNLGLLELENLDRFGVYPRLHFGDRSYSNLDEFRFAGSLAHLLRNYGVGSGDRTLVMMPNSPELMASFPAIWTIGASIVPVIPQWTAPEVANILSDSDASILLTSPSHAPRLKEAMNLAGIDKRLLVFGESDVDGAININPFISQLSPLETPVNRSASDMAILLYTSGTTGKPKGVVLTHGNMRAALDGVFRQNPDLERGVTLHSLPLTHVYGVLVQQVSNLWGCTMVLLPQFDPTRALEAIERHRVRYLPLVPTMAVYLLRHPERKRFDTSSLFRITCGGAALPEQLRQDLEDAFHCRVDQGYGLSESASIATGYELRRPYRPGSAGQAVPGVELCIMDDHGQLLPPCRIGEICVAGPNITAGYWRNTEATGEAIKGKWLRTGDVGYLDEDGYLYITDRKKDLIIKGGENISPREIEEALYLHPSVVEAAVIGLPDPVFGEQICAVVQLTSGALVTEDEIRQHVGKYVTRFKVPARVVFQSALPKNNAGKILKREIRAGLAGARSSL
ncbi:MAG TPA: AMP-binding protein [Bryobacteraceae bacterium]|nr:AMP-binding protein [Bryobacteraceae bacterium]